MSAAVLIISNPAAGVRQPAWREPVTRILSALGPVEFVQPGSPDATTAAARDAEARGVSLVVAAGGDGTVHRVVNGLSSVETHVGLLPLGVVNDLAAHLQQSRSPVEAAQAMLSGAFLDIDVIRINRVRVVTIAGFAVVANAVTLGDRWRRRCPWLGRSAYTLAAAATIVRHGGDPVGGSIVVNQPTFGGHLRLPFESRNNDGVCEVVTLHGGGRVRLARAWLAMATAAPAPTSALSWVSLSRTTLEFDRDVPVVGDGEDLGRGRDFQISVEHAAVRIRCARAAAGEALPALDPERVSALAISSATE